MLLICDSASAKRRAISDDWREHPKYNDAAATFGCLSHFLGEWGLSPISVAASLHGLNEYYGK
jgi:hypothetical protein